MKQKMMAVYKELKAVDFSVSQAGVKSMLCKKITYPSIKMLKRGSGSRLKAVNKHFQQVDQNVTLNIILKIKMTLLTHKDYTTLGMCCHAENLKKNGKYDSQELSIFF